jgi:hypothetical protein
MDGGGVEVERCDSDVSVSSSLDSMVQCPLADRRDVKDAHRMVVSSGIAVVSMAGLARSMR